jgi:hypothetical protein
MLARPPWSTSSVGKTVLLDPLLAPVISRKKNLWSALLRCLSRFGTPLDRKSSMPLAYHSTVEPMLVDSCSISQSLHRSRSWLTGKTRSSRTPLLRMLIVSPLSLSVTSPTKKERSSRKILMPGALETEAWNTSRLRL